MVDRYRCVAAGLFGIVAVGSAPAFAQTPGTPGPCRDLIEITDIKSVSVGQGQYDYVAVFKSKKLDLMVQGTLAFGTGPAGYVSQQTYRVVFYPSAAAVFSQQPFGRGTDATLNIGKFIVTYDQGNPGTMTAAVTACSSRTIGR